MKIIGYILACIWIGLFIIGLVKLGKDIIEDIKRKN